MKQARYLQPVTLAPACATVTCSVPHTAEYMLLAVQACQILVQSKVSHLNWHVGHLHNSAGKTHNCLYFDTTSQHHDHGFLFGIQKCLHCTCAVGSQMLTLTICLGLVAQQRWSERDQRVRLCLLCCALHL
ncbi:TPA: hypothetical protein ACH3X3_014982 [Trebouxia sp. C0006]